MVKGEGEQSESLYPNLILNSRVLDINEGEPHYGNESDSDVGSDNGHDHEGEENVNDQGSEQSK